MLLVPMMFAIQNIISRMMRKFNSASLSCYQNPILGIVSWLIILYIGEDTTYISDIVRHHPIVFLIFIFSGCVALSQQVMKIVAAKHTTASKLAIYQYLSVPY